jgi:hypothetical protein
MNNDAMTLLSAGALLPESIGPYIGLMLAGFAVAIFGHMVGSRWLVTVGVIMIMLATLLFPLALQFLADEPSPPGPKVPLATVGAIR